MNYEILAKSVFAVVSAGLGALIVFSIKLNHEKLCMLISFSAGALLGAAAFTLLPESSHNTGLIELILSTLSGYTIFWVITKYYSHVCPACSATHFDERTTKKFSEITLTLFTALAFHSLLDGIALSAGGGVHSDDGNSLFLAITTHKFPEGLALASLMLGANYNKSKILLYVFAVESTTIIGSIIGEYFVQSSLSQTVYGILMAHIAGGFIFLALHAVLGEMLKNHKKMVLISVTMGILLILIVRIMI